MTDDPTTTPPPSYTKDRADAVLGEAFRRLLEYVKGARIPGDFVEFGTLRGYTARWIASLMAELEIEGDLWLYDTFEGMPEVSNSVDGESYEIATHGVWRPGSMCPDPDIEVRIETVLSSILEPDRVHVVKGLFEDTFDTHSPSGKVALAHIDCDLYASSRFVLDRLLDHDLLQDGCLLVFDDYNCNRASPRFGERRALSSALERQNRFEVESFFNYGWHGHAFFVHDRETTR